MITTLYRRIALTLSVTAVLSMAYNAASAADNNPGLSVSKSSPFALVTFKTENRNNQMISSWTVNNEENVRAYELEGSEDGSTFKKIRSIIAKKSGTYSMVNRRPSNHCDYYRLKTIHADGMSSYSAIVSTKEEEKITCYKLAVAKEFINQPGTIRIVTSEGSVIMEKESANLKEVEKLDVSGLGAGTYSVSVIVGIKTESKTLDIKR